MVVGSRPIILELRFVTKAKASHPLWHHCITNSSKSESISLQQAIDVFEGILSLPLLRYLIVRLAARTRPKLRSISKFTYLLLPLLA